ncbi:MAG: hypothetical protein LBR24_02085, partial [Methanobrevibacter sp.]|nr:hypothetical protein [Methanobrevibacter sp.]
MDNKYIAVIVVAVIVVAGVAFYFTSSFGGVAIDNVFMTGVIPQGDAIVPQVGTNISLALGQWFVHYKSSDTFYEIFGLKDPVLIKAGLTNVGTKKYSNLNINGNKWDIYFF